MFIARFKSTAKYFETNRKNIRILFLSFLVLFSLSSCQNDDGPEPESVRTVIVYMAAENGLADGNYHIKDINEMIKGCKNIPANSDLVIFLDDPDGSRIFSINRNQHYSDFVEMEPEYVFHENVNSASGDCLKNVLQYVELHHHSKSYGIIMWSHGTGWINDDTLSRKNVKHTLRKSFGLDNQEGTVSNVGFKMEITKMKEALSLLDFDFILFDACFMQSIEVAYELRNSAKYIIASPAEIPAPGAPYDRLMRYLFSESFDPDKVVDEYYSYYLREEPRYGLLLSAIKTDRLEQFASMTRKVLSSHTLEKLDVEDVQNYFEYGHWGEWMLPDMFDINGVMMTNLATSDYDLWKNELDSLVVSSCCSDSWYSNWAKYDVDLDINQYSGVSMFIPLQKYVRNQFPYYNSYYDTEWAKAILEQK